MSRVIKLWKWEFYINIKFTKVKTLILPIPDWAEVTGVEDPSELQPHHRVKYWRGETPHYIDLPECDEAEEVSVSSLYNKDRTACATDRTITVKLITYYGNK